MKIFVTGSTGLLGNNLVRQLLARGHAVTGLARSREKAARLFGDLDVEIVVGDMRAIDGFVAALPGHDAIVHTAAYFREYYTPGDHAEALRAINVDATCELMRRADAARIPRFVHIGSSGAVGMHGDGRPGDEDTPPHRRQLQNLYFRSKYEGDQEIRALTRELSLAVLEILPGWMWGPGDAAPTGAGKLALDIMAGALPAVPDGMAQVVDVRDVAAAIVAALEQPPPRDRYVVAGRPLGLREVTHAVAIAADAKPPRVVPIWMALVFAHLSEWLARWRGGTPKVPVAGVRTFAHPHRVSSARAERDLRVSFRPFDETARDAVAWFRRHALPAPDTGDRLTESEDHLRASSPGGTGRPHAPRVARSRP